MGDINTRMFDVMGSKKLKAVDLAKKLNIPPNTISAWKNRGTDPSSEYIAPIAEFLGVTTDYLLGRDEKIQQFISNGRKAFQSASNVVIPLFSNMPTNQPDAAKEIIGREEIPLEWTREDQEYIAIRVSGDAMYPKYIEGDIVVIKLQNDCNSGDDAIVLIRGKEATLNKPQGMA